MIISTITSAALALVLIACITSSLLVPGGVVSRQVGLATVTRAGREIRRVRSLKRTLVAGMPAIVWLMYLAFQEFRGFRWCILRRMRSRSVAAFAMLGALLAAAPVAAQWFSYPTAGVPRRADGSVNMSAPTPRLADGKPDFSGIWMTADPSRPTSGLSSPGNQAGPREGQTTHDTPGDPTAIRSSRQMANIGVDLPGGLPYQPWLVPIVEARTANDAIDDPHIRCLPDNFLRAYGLPHLLKFVHTPGLLVVLNEMNAGYRQVFTDARPLPKDPNPSWQGYSSATWAGDTLVIDTIGLRDDTWIDWNGSVLTESARVREEMRRPDFGHLEIRATVDDPKAYTRPWTVTLRQRIVVDTELVDEICLENEKFFERSK